MIVPMRKVFVVTRRRDRERLLDALGELGVVHLTPAESGAEGPAEKVAAKRDRAERARQALAGVEPAGEPSDVPDEQIADAVLKVYQQSVEKQSRLDSLNRQLDQLEMWGDVRLEQFRTLEDAGVAVKFFSVPAEDADDVSAEVVEAIRELPNDRLLVAAATRDGEIEAPESAEEVPLPQRDRPDIRAEAAGIDRALREDRDRLAALAGRMDDLDGQIERLRIKAKWSAARRGGLQTEGLFGVQGWAPAEDADDLGDALRRRGLDAAVEYVDPDPDEDPPTLIRYPRWARPMKAMFDLLGTVPGYREYDVSPFFMVALPIFAAMLFGDAGYGLVFTAVALAMRGKIRARAGGNAANLILVFGLTTLVWGVLTANYFGVTPQDMLAAGGIWAWLGAALKSLAPLWSTDQETARNLIIKVSFVFGSIHLILAHLRQALGYAPNVRFIAELGWSSFLAGMLGLIWLLFFPKDVWMPTNVMFALLGVGGAAVVLFSYPSRNPAKVVGLGVIANILPMISTFSDTISYIRLMAVGLASYYIASAFNGLGARLADLSGWLIPFAVIVIVAAHLLNIALGVIALFAHGVRLNMLEFSSNAGVQWSGYPYAPFAENAEQGES